MRRTGRRQAGLLLPALLAGMLGLVLVLLAAREQISLHHLTGQQALRQAQQAATVRQRLTDWYQQNQFLLTQAAGAAPAPATVLADLRAPGPWHALLGTVHACAGARGASVFAWVDSTQGPAQFDPVRQGLIGAHADTQLVVVDGCALQQAAVQQANRTLQRVAQRLESWFQARVADDPRHRLDRNYFQEAAPTCVAGPDQLPCLPDYVPVTGLAFFQRQLGLQPSELVGPWGSPFPVEVSAGAPASQQPPYSLALRLQTPWGDALAAQAVQPGA